MVYPMDKMKDALGNESRQNLSQMNSKHLRTRPFYSTDACPSCKYQLKI